MLVAALFSPVCAERKKPSALTENWAPTQQGESTSNAQAEATAAGSECRDSSQLIHGQGGCTARGHGGETGLSSKVHLTYNGRLKESKS